MNAPKIHLNLPYKLALPGASKIDRTLIGAAHIALAINATTLFFGILPFGGIASAIALCSIAYFRRSPFARDAAQQGFMRAIFALALVVLVQSISQNGSVLENWSTWILLFVVQTPLSVYDAWRTSKGYMGLRILPVRHKNVLK